MIDFKQQNGAGESARRCISAGILIMLFSLAAGAQEIDWHAFDSGLHKAAEEDKPLIVYFNTEWCGVCKKMESLVFPQPLVQPFLTDSLVPVMMDAEDTLKTISIARTMLSPSQIAARYQVDRYPTFLFLEPSGKLLLKLTGFQKTRDFHAILSRISSRAYQRSE